jgi:hypothetical protein
MIIYTRTRLLAIQCSIAAALIASETLLAAPESYSTPPHHASALARTDPDETLNVTREDYNACCQVLKSIIDGYDHNDAAAVQALFYYKPGTDPKTIDLSDHILELDVAAYRLANAALAHFGMHGAMLHTGVSTNVKMLLDILSQIGLQNARIMGDTLTITPPAITGGSGWPQKPLYFVRIENTWKFDAGRTFRLTFTAVRRQHVEGETPEQAFATGIHLLAGGLASIAEDIEKGDIPTEAEAQKRVHAVRDEMKDQFLDFGCNTSPR